MIFLEAQAPRVIGRGGDPPSRSCATMSPTVSEQTTIYVIAAAAAVLSLAAWLWWIVVPTWKVYARWWERLVAVVLSVYVLAALVLAGAALGAAALLYADKLG